MGADKKGDSVWAANFKGNNLARVNIHTLETRYYRLPMLGHPYRVDFDVDHNAWTMTHSDDRVLKLNPKTGQWTVFQLPTNGCEQRHMTFDQQRNEFWSTCYRAAKIVRIQFRGPHGEAPRLTPLPDPPMPAHNPGPGISRVDYDMQLAMTPSTLPERALLGRKLFSERCASCHDPSDTGRTYAPRLASARMSQMGEAALRQKIEQGSLKMPAFRYMFNGEQIGSIVEFLRTR
jgi:hypothetical protein